MKNTEIFNASQWKIVDRLVTLELVKAIKEANEEHQYIDAYDAAGRGTYSFVWEEVSYIYSKLPENMRQQAEEKASTILVDYADGKFPVRVTTILFDKIVTDVLSLIKN